MRSMVEGASALWTRSAEKKMKTKVGVRLCAVLLFSAAEAPSTALRAVPLPRCAGGKTTHLRSDCAATPMPWISTSQVSPFFIHTGGLRAWPTPDGVPVKMTSPGSSVIPCGDIDQHLDDRKHHVVGVVGLHHGAVEPAFDLESLGGVAAVRRR